MSIHASVLIHREDGDYGVYVHNNGFPDVTGAALLTAVRDVGLLSVTDYLQRRTNGRDVSSIGAALGNVETAGLALEVYDNEPVEYAYFYKAMSSGQRLYDANAKRLIDNLIEFVYVFDVPNRELLVFASAFEEPIVIVAEAEVLDLSKAAIEDACVALYTAYQANGDAFSPVPLRSYID